MASQDQSNLNENTEPNPRSTERDSKHKAQREGNLGNERNRESEDIRNRPDEGDRGSMDRGGDRLNDSSRLPE